MNYHTKLEDLKDQLAELKKAFDTEMLRGSSFQEVKKIYLHIKELKG